MSGREKIAWCAFLVAQNPACLLILIPVAIFCIPLLLVFVAFYLLIKVLEVAQVAHRRRAAQQLLEEPKIVLIRGERW